MANLSVKYGFGEGQVAGGFGLSLGVGLVGVSGYIGIDSKNAISFNVQATFDGWALKVGESDAELTVAVGRGIIAGVGYGISEFSGVQYSTQSGWGLNAGLTVTEPSLSGYSGRISATLTDPSLEPTLFSVGAGAGMAYLAGASIPGGAIAGGLYYFTSQYLSQGTLTSSASAFTSIVPMTGADSNVNLSNAGSPSDTSQGSQTIIIATRGAGDSLDAYANSEIDKALGDAFYDPANSLNGSAALPAAQGNSGSTLNGTAGQIEGLPYYGVDAPQYGVQPSTLPQTPEPQLPSTNGQQNGDNSGNFDVNQYAADNSTITYQDPYANADFSGGDDTGGDGGYSPVILNLNGKGVQITQLNESNVYYDMAGDGNQLEHRTAWAAPGNAVLVYDPGGGAVTPETLVYSRYHLANFKQNRRKYDYGLLS